jgi:hypothetical protein
VSGSEKTISPTVSWSVDSHTGRAHAVCYAAIEAINMKKLLAGFGLLLATGCTQPNTAHVDSQLPHHHYLVYVAADAGASVPQRWKDDGGEWRIDQPNIVHALVDLACMEIESVGGPATFTCGEPFYSTERGAHPAIHRELMAGKPITYSVRTGAYSVGVITLD